ncbi:hypothetical protein WJX73_009297 [Symbiochloris irregularis]|uniref:5-amino-6-(5-phosphoribosylamino)uracil reductase n=1 Tax=Symbiochloris irregularis TaxID=706552 RepID=A0AAW1NQV2_9CHLO
MAHTSQRCSGQLWQAEAKTTAGHHRLSVRLQRQGRSSGGTHRRQLCTTFAISEGDCRHLVDTAALANSSAGLVQPFPRSACSLVSPVGEPVAAAYQRAQGSISAEEQATSQAGPSARGATAYVNLETGDCHGEDAAVRSLLEAGVSRVVVGLRYPLQHRRGEGISALRRAGVTVEVLGEGTLSAGDEAQANAIQACLQVNEALLHRAATGRPLSVLKYAMTLDGKIATSSGHAAWVSCAESRARVFAMRARSDAVIVGGNTVRRDNPNLTTRQEGGHAPVRIVMSRTLDLPEDANLWDLRTAPTIVMTQSGARKAFQDMLRARGVEVVQFDFLTPDAVAAYCHDRGFLQCLWECGGTLAAPAIASRVIHKAMAFIAPKLIGGVRAPSPVGELGNVEMTQALTLCDTTWEPSGADFLLQGYLPASGGLSALQQRLARADSQSALVNEARHDAHSESEQHTWASSNGARTALGQQPSALTAPPKPVEFFKAWDEWGALSNFSPHPISMPEGAADSSFTQLQPAGNSGTPAASSNGKAPAQHRLWRTVEHYYQAQKFAGVNNQDAFAVIDAIAAADPPEEAAKIGRATQRASPELVRPDWDTAKLFVMLAALQAKFKAHPGPRKLLLSTCRYAEHFV